MTKELSEAALEEVLVQMRTQVDDRSKTLVFKPTKMFVPKYPDETNEQYRLRYSAAKALSERYFK